MSRARKSAAPALEWRTSIARTGDRLKVWCHVRHLLSSGATVVELFDQVRAELEKAARDAAARDPDRPLVTSTVDLQLEFNVADPEIWLVLHDPAAVVTDVAGQLGRLQQMLEKVVAAERANIARWFPHSAASA